MTYPYEAFLYVVISCPGAVDLNLFEKKILLEETCIVPLSILRCMNRYVVRRGWSTPRERSLEHLLLFNFNSQLTNIQ